MRAIGFATLLLLSISGAQAATVPFATEPPAIEHARLDRSAVTYDVRRDLTFDETLVLDYTLLTARGLQARERSMMTFYPKTQTLDVVEAWVMQPDGTRIDVLPAQIFTRPSAASQGAPGFTGSMTTTVLYPQLREGSRTHIKWHLAQNTPPMLGFNIWSEPPLQSSMSVGTVDVTIPADLALHWDVRGGYRAEDRVVDGVRHVSAHIESTRAEEPERNMVDSSDFQPLFLATTLPDLKEVGAIYHRGAEGRASVTPEIAELAARLAGDKQGLDAARAVYNWVAANIRYVAVYMDPNDGWIPHPAADVLSNGYGDCKDHVVLMTALLAARGIRAETGIIDWGTHTKDLPLWLPGQFNHVIVWLPDFDVFANPTNPYAKFEALDRRLSGKTVVIASEQGEVRQTPATRPADNRYAVESHVTVAEDGSIDGTSRIAMSANMDSQMRGALASATSPHELAERVLGSSPEGGFGDFRSGAPRDLTQELDLVGVWHSPHGLTFQGSHAFMPVPTGLDLQPPSRLRQYLAGSGQRRHAVLAGASDLTWSTELTTPPEMRVDALPSDVALSNRAGRYTARYQRTASGARIERHLVIDRDVIEAEDYAALEALLYAPLDDSRTSLVLAKGDAPAE